MRTPLDSATLLREVRRRASLSQRDLASLAGTSQSVVARIESGETSPTVRTLTHLLKAAGMDLRIELVSAPVPDSHMLDDVVRIRALTPEERLDEVARLARFAAAATRV